MVSPITSNPGSAWAKDTASAKASVGGARRMIGFYIGMQNPGMGLMSLWRIAHRAYSSPS
jgi:hypothetical protein